MSSWTGGAPGAGAGGVEDVEDEAGVLAVEFAVEEAGALDFEGDGVAGGPAGEVSQEVAVVGEVIEGEAAVEVGGEIGDAGSGGFVEDQAGDLGLGRAHVDDFWWGGGEGGDVGQEYLGGRGDGEGLEGAAEFEDIGFIKASEDGVAFGSDGGLVAALGAVRPGANSGVRRK